MITLPDLWNTGLCGRLGNQLFQVAAAYAHSLRSGHELIVPETPIASYFRGPLKTVPRDALPRATSVWVEQGHEYTPLPFPRDNDVFALRGYFQSEKYFAGYRGEIWNFFEPSRDTLRDAQHALADFPRPIVVVAVRRGDYVEKQNYHPLMPLSYYEGAIALFPEAKTLLVVSDDLEWCETNLRFPNLAFLRVTDPWTKIVAMSLCDGHVIANSSFSWWGAWLAASPYNKVVAPATWFGPAAAHLNTKDIVPERWIKI